MVFYVESTYPNKRHDLSVLAKHLNHLLILLDSVDEWLQLPHVAKPLCRSMLILQILKANHERLMRGVPEALLVSFLQVSLKSFKRCMQTDFEGSVSYS